MIKPRKRKEERGAVDIERGQRLKEARLALELTQEEFGEKMGITRGTVSNLECGDINPATPKYLKCFEAFHNINHRWLLAGEGEMFLPPKELQLFLKIIENITPEALKILQQEIEKLKKPKDEESFNIQNDQLLELTDKSKEESEKIAKEIVGKCIKMEFEEQRQVFLTAALLTIGEEIGAERIKNEDVEKDNHKNNWKKQILIKGEHAGKMEQKLIEKEKATSTYKVKK